MTARVKPHHTPIADADFQAAKDRLEARRQQGGLPEEWDDRAMDFMIAPEPSREWVEQVEELLEEAEFYHAWESHHDPDRPAAEGMSREEALDFAADLRTSRWQQPEAAGFADRLANAGGDAARAAIAEEARKALGLMRGEIPFDQRVEAPATRCYAVTHSESGRAEFCEAASHEEALRKIDPLMRYSSEHSEWPEYDRATDKGELVDAHLGHQEFIREYGSITSRDCPAWDESAGDMMMVSDPDMDQDILVYPVLVRPSDLPAESDPLPGWEGGLAREFSPEYGTWTRTLESWFLVVSVQRPDDRFTVPAEGFRYRWTVMPKGYGGGPVAWGEGLPTAAAAQEAAEVALDDHLKANRKEANR